MKLWFFSAFHPYERSSKVKKVHARAVWPNIPRHEGSYENRGWFFIQFIQELCEESPTFIQNLVVKPSYGNRAFRVNFWWGSSNNFPRTVFYANIALRVTSFNNILYVLTTLAPWTLYVNIAFWVISLNNIPCHCKIHGRPVFISLMPYA